MPGGNWTVSDCNISMETADGAVFGDSCVREPDGSLDRCGALCMVRDAQGHLSNCSEYTSNSLLLLVMYIQHTPALDWSFLIERLPVILQLDTSHARPTSR